MLNFKTKKRFVLKLLSALFIFLFISKTFSQNRELLEQYIRGYTHYNKYYQEYFYTQVNKSGYFPGETIWFQTYVVEKQKEHLSDKTKKIYAALYNLQGHLIEKKILEVSNGMADHFFKIPAGYHSSKLFLKISSDWSRNFSSNFIKEIKVNVKPKKAAESSNVPDTLPKVFFFPESGHLIEDVPARVGVKVSDRYGNGFTFSGEIVDDLGNPVLIFKTNHLGLGSFIFHPVKNRKYRLRQFFNVDTTDLFLPQPEKKGVLFNVLKKDDEFRVFFRTNRISDQHTPYYYIIYNNYKVSVAGSFNFNGGITSMLVFGQADLNRGLNTIILFDHMFNPVAERVFFNDREIILDKKIITATTVSQKDSVNIMLYNKSVDSVYHVAVSILPAESIFQTFKSTFISDYYLSSEVKGTIEDPGFYFRNSKNLEQIDYLLLTQGWRKFDWKQIKQLKLNKLIGNEIKYLFEKGIAIKGKIVNSGNNIPLKSETLTLFYKDKVFYSTSNDLGKFIFADMNLKKDDTVKLYVNQGKKMKKRILISKNEQKLDTVIFWKPESERIKPKGKKTIVTENFESIINTYGEGEELEEVELYVKSDQNNFKDEEKTDMYVNPMENTVFTKSFYVNDKNVDQYRSVLAYLESLPELQVVANGSDIAIYSSRAMQQDIINGAKRPIDIYIDNMKLSKLDIETLDMIPMNQVRNINVNKSGIGFGGENPFGRISIYLNYGAAIYKFEGSAVAKDASNVLQMIIKEGFERSRKYYTPVYKFAPEDDYYRKFATIHWQPHINIVWRGAGFNIKVPDPVTSCVLLIEGISEKGHIISLKKAIKVNKNSDF